MLEFLHLLRLARVIIYNLYTSDLSLQYFIPWNVQILTLLHVMPMLCVKASEVIYCNLTTGILSMNHLFIYSLGNTSSWALEFVWKELLCVEQLAQHTWSHFFSSWHVSNTITFWLSCLYQLRNTCIYIYICELTKGAVWLQWSFTLWWFLQFQSQCKMIYFSPI